MNWIKSFLIPLLVSGVFYFLETMSKPECTVQNFSCLLKNEIYNDRSEIGIAIVIISAIVSGVIHLKLLNEKRQLVSEILQNFLEKNLGGNYQNNRITIFEVCGFITALLYFFRSTIMNIRYFYRKECLGFRLNLCPIPFHNYLRVYERVGQPNMNKRSTIFMAPSNERKVDGFAPHIYYSRLRDDAKSLPDLDSEALIYYKSLREMPSELAKIVTQYMVDSYIINFERLKTIRRLSRFISGFPLFCSKNQKVPSHVIIFDSNSEEINLDALSDPIKMLSDHIALVIKK